MSGESLSAEAVLHGWDAYSSEEQRCVAAVGRSDVLAVAGELLAAVSRSGRVFVVGNGGSAATASHFASDLNCAGRANGLHRIKAMSLTEAVPAITAIANDVGYARIFSEQLASLLERPDLLVAVSAMGNSPSIVAAAELARSRGARVAALLGNDGGAVARRADAAVVVDSAEYPHIENVHLTLCHFLAQLARQAVGL